MEATLLSLGLALVITMGSFFFYRGFRNSQKVSWANIAIGISLLLLCYGWIIVATINDWGIVAFIQILFGSGAAVLSGLSLAVILDRWKKVVRLIVAIGVPPLFDSAVSFSAYIYGHNACAPTLACTPTAPPRGANTPLSQAFGYLP